MSLQPVRPLLQAGAVAVLLCIAGRFGDRFTDHRTNVSLLHPGLGIALAALLFWGRHVLLATLVAGLALELIRQTTFPALLLAPVALTVAAWLGSLLLRRVNLKLSLDRPRDVVALIVIGAVIAPLPSALLGAAVNEGFASSFFEWWLADALGVLLFAPVVLTWFAPTNWSPRRQRFELIAWGLLLLIATVVVYGEPYSSGLIHPQLPFLVLPVLLWSAARFDHRTTATALLVVAVIALITTSVGIGPFAQNSIESGLIYLLTYLAVVSVTTLLLSAVLLERGRAAEQLQAAEHRFSTLAQHSHIGIWHITPDGRSLFVNPAVCAMLEVDSAEELTGQLYQEFFTPGSLEVIARQRDFRLHGQSSTYEVEVVGRRGARHNVIVCGVPLMTANGRLESLIGTLTDITERRRMEQTLLQAEQQAKQLAEAELVQARAELVRNAQLSALGRLAASIAHELRNPLGAIRNAIFYLRRRIPSGEAHWPEYLDIMDHEVSVSDRIINNLLDLTRARAPAHEELDAGDLIRDAFRRLAPPAGVLWSVTLTPEPFRLFADPVQLRQVMDNLLRNAIEALPLEGTISVAGCIEGEYATLTVQDNGPGVQPEHRSSLFEPLFSTRAKGTGLGLYISRQIIERHGGTLEYLADCVGAVFQIRLPLKKPRP